jgi:uridylate kinase
MKYKKILLKLSGEALAGNEKFGYSEPTLIKFCQEISEIANNNIQIGIVIGGGNIFRGLKGIDKGFDRVKGDYMGMLATVMNGLALQNTFESIGSKARVLTSTFMEPFAERYIPDRAKRYMENGEIIIFSGGTSNPFFTTDSAAALRAIEINADILLKGTNVDGIYTKDPNKFNDAKKYNTISFKEAIEKNLKVMDITAFSLCYENNMPIRVFNIHKKGNLSAIVKGQNIGTLVE